MKPPSIIGSIKIGCIAAGLAISSLLAGCAGSTSALPQSAGSPTIAQQSALQSALTVQPDVYTSWRESLHRMGLPSSGCFTTTYPSNNWTRVACSTPPNLLYPMTSAQAIRARAALATQSVGNGDDYTIDTGSNLISEAIGSFPVVTGVTSVKSVENPEFGCCGENGKNSYTLQLNSYFFTSKACNGQSDCAGWEQFVYENPPGSSEGQLFIQDWLVPTGSNSVKCPSGKGWESADGGCVQNSPNAVDIPNVAIKNLASLVETGEAASSGDSEYLSVGSTEYGMKNIQGDGITDLASNWEGAEFNVIGNAGGDIADFNCGSTIEVQLEANDGVTSAPTCPADSGTTGESNNLTFKAAPSGSDQTYPSILFKMSNVSGGGSGSCDALSGT
jgi:hypothetical protein